jgi:glucose dehydrogenase
MRLASRSVEVGRGHLTRSISRPGCCTSPVSIRRRTLSLARARVYTKSVVVLDAKTGNYKHHFKIVPKDWHDWDVSNPPVLIRSAGGKELMLVAPKDGHLYGFDLANNDRLYRVPVTTIENVEEGSDHSVPERTAPSKHRHGACRPGARTSTCT